MAITVPRGQKPQPIFGPSPSEELDNLIKVSPLVPPLPYEFDDRLCDITLIAKDGQLKAESSILCRNSEVFWNMRNSGMTETQTKEISVTEWSLETVKLAYNLLPGITKSSVTIPTDEEDFVELLSFVHAYSFQEILHHLKLYMIGEIKGILARTTQLYFDLDTKYQLGIRQHLLKAIIDGYRKGQFNRGITDIEIYLDLTKIIFKTEYLERLDKNQEYNTLIFSFVHSFCESGLDGYIIYEYFGINNLPMKTIYLTLIANTISDIQLRQQTIFIIQYLALKGWVIFPNPMKENFQKIIVDHNNSRKKRMTKLGEEEKTKKPRIEKEAIVIN